MIKRIAEFRSKLSLVRGLIVGGAAVSLLCQATQASAQLSRVGVSTAAIANGVIIRGTDTAYDPVNGVFLIVGSATGPVFGVFVDASGVPVTGAFPITDGSTGSAKFPRAVYSPDVNNGQGGFLVTWHQDVIANFVGNVNCGGTANCVFGRLVSMNAPGGLASGIQQISDVAGGSSYWEIGSGMAYSKTSHRFLVAWQTLAFGVQGRFVDVNGTPSGPVMQLENSGGSRDPVVAWNPATDEFGLLYTGWGGSGALAAFRRVRASDGFLSARTTMGFWPGTYATGIDVNAANQYVLVWGLGPGTLSAVFDQNGTQLTAPTLVTSRLGLNQSLGMAYNATTGTFLVVSQDTSSYDIAAVEMTASGQPNSTAQVITDGGYNLAGSYYPMTKSRAGTNQWDVVYSLGYTQARNQIVASSTTGAPPAHSTVADFTGDRKSEIAVFRPTNGAWYLLQSGSGFQTGVGYTWGMAGDIPVPGDYDGDGRIDIAVFRPSTGTWFILTSSSNYTASMGYRWGTFGDVPVPGDYDGDGKTDLAVFRPANATWYVLTSSSGFAGAFAYVWGALNGDVPVAADFDGDGRTDIAVYRLATGQWFIAKSSANFTTSVAYQWGNPGDIPVPGDFDGDGKTDVAIYRPSSGLWALFLSSTGFTRGAAYSWGAPGDIPVQGDFDGDGRADIAVFRPANGTWYILTSSSGFGGMVVYAWGSGGDIPILR